MHDTRRSNDLDVRGNDAGESRGTNEALNEGLSRIPTAPDDMVGNVAISLNPSLSLVQIV